MTEKLGFFLTIFGFILAAAGYVWLLVRTFRASEPWGLAILFVPALVPVAILTSLRRSWAPALLMIIGAGLVATPVGIKNYQQRFLPLEEIRTIVAGEAHVTLTGWNKHDYALLEKLPDTVVLQMANSEVTDETLKYLKGMSKLRELDLNDTQVTDGGLKYLTELPNLQQLRLRNTTITDDGFTKNLAPMASLRRVELTGTKVTGKTLREWKKGSPGRDFLN
jgi:hypothetical protein